MRRSLLVCLAGAQLAAAGCASRPAAPAGSAADDDAGAVRTGSANVLTQQDLERVAQQNLHEVIRTTRPRWLQHRGAGSLGERGEGQPVEVYVNGRTAGGVDALASIPKGAVDRVLYFPVVEAQARYGMTVRGPLIDVRLKVGGGEP